MAGKKNLVGAIDGASVAFAVTGGGGVVNDMRRYRSADFPTFTDALQTYTRAEALSPDGLCLGLAVAGVSRGDVITLPNCRWFISVRGLRAFLRAEPLIINDFAATAWSLTNLPEGAVRRVGLKAAGRPRAGGTYLVVGCGSGLGMAAMRITADGTPLILESEGGHASFAPGNAADDALLAALRARLGHVSFERLLSLSGLQNIYAVLAAHHGRTAAPPRPETIIATAIGGTDPIAVEAAAMFGGALGAFVGNGILACGAWDGVYLVGAMLGDLLPLIERGPFRARMTGKGRMAKLLEDVPVGFAANEAASLCGAAAALRAHLPCATVEAERPAA